MTSALVIGGTGWIGRRLCARLAARGVAVTALMLPPRHGRQPRIPSGVRAVRADRNDEAAMAALLARDVDLLFDLIAYEPEQVRMLVEAASGRIGRHVHLSTAAVYRSFPDRGRAAEDDIQRFEDGRPGYGPRKAACERVLERACAERSFPAVILRPAPLIGADDPCSREHWFAERMRAGRDILHPGPADGHLWLLPVDELVEALLLAAAAPTRVLGRSYHLALEDAPRLSRHVSVLAEGLGLEATALMPTSPETLREAGLALYGIPYAKPLGARPGTGAARADLGWRPRPYSEAMAEVIGDLRGKDHSHPAWPGRDALQARLSGTHEWLHSAGEARLDSGLAPQWLDPDELLARLAGENGAEPPLRAVTSGRWRPSRPASPACIIGPADLCSRLGIRAGPMPAGTANGDGLLGVLEWDRWKQDRAWLFTAPDRSAEPYYGISGRPAGLELRDYSRHEAAPSDPATRLLLLAFEAADEEALSRDLARYAADGGCRVDDIGILARQFLVGMPRLRRQVGKELAPWLLVRAVARLLQASGMAGAARITMGSAQAGARAEAPRLPPDAALCLAGEEWLVADVRTGRVGKVPLPVAKVLLNSLSARATARNPRVQGERLALP